MRLRSMRPGALLVNIARGQNVDTDALVRVLWRSGTSAATRATSGTRSPPPPTTRGAACRGTR
ncbi:NAD(P)-dependent oxidoreductase [Saccharopolyspora gregorii]|uniref:D-isomer specific 2-hydroxyacid dehydrogenase NAD-binding domain-containing protein n=1 Tax=Saccharopolyspora gregorii TaxID=33914 RepID=A0ABP6S345_9PSEU